MTTISLTCRLLLGAATAAALLGGCNKHPADQPPTPAVSTPEQTTPATPPNNNTTPNNTTPATPPAATPPAQGSAPPATTQ